MSSISRIFRTFFSTSTAASVAKPPPAKSFSVDLYNERNLKRVVHKFKKLSESHLFRKHATVYAATVRRLAAAKKHNWIEEILEDQKQYDEISKEGFAVRLISLYGKSGMLDHASKVFDEMPERKCPQTVKSFNALLGACVNAKRFDRLEGYFRQLPVKLSVKPDVVSYNTAIKAFCEMGALDQAVAMLDELEKNGLKPDLITFNTLLIGFYSNRKFLDGEKLWAKMADSKVSPDVRTYNARLVGLVAEKKLSEAVEFFNELGSKGVKPDEFSYNSVIHGFCNEGDLGQAKSWFGKLVGSDSAPNKATFAGVMRLACKTGDIDWGVELFKETIRAKFLIDPSVMQLVIDGLVNGSRVEEAKKLVGIGNSNKFRCYNLTMPVVEGE